MKRGERAQLTVRRLDLCCEPQLGLGKVETKEAPRASYRSEEEKLEFASARKDVGARLFKEGRYMLAMERYKKAEENKVKAKELKKTCKLNKAACQLKLKLFFEAKASCDTVLKDDSHHVKALFRRAQAEFGLKNFDQCLLDAKKVLELEPGNREARNLAKEAAAAQKEEDKKSKGFFGKMPLLLKRLLATKVFESPRRQAVEKVEHAFKIAREYLEPVSSTEHQCIDLNQWHVMVFALVVDAHVSATQL
eukprot:Skav209739  [mRNA]  locus=scaffold2057:21048:24320:- [translate_table: standard]